MISIGPHLPDVLVEKAIIAITGFHDLSCFFKALLALAPVMPRALSVAREIATSVSRPIIRVDLCISVAENLPENERVDLFAEALAAHE